MRTMRRLSPTLSLAAIFLFTLWLTAISSAHAPLDVVVSEVAWMGTIGAWQDEWLELHNNTDTDIDLTGWRLVTDDVDPDILLDGIIPAGGNYLLERTDDTTIVGHTADFIYTGNLSNSPGEVITLTDELSNIVDVVGLPGQPWFAGDNATKETMVRDPLTASGTAATSWANGPVNGTPINSIVDRDGDTYGFSPNFDWTAGTGVGYEQWDEDCDDADLQIYPGAPEVLDYKDNDCDGQVDDGLDLGPLDWTVFFNSGIIIDALAKTTDPVPMEAAFLDDINAATTTIDLAAYGLDRVSVSDVLIAAHNRGVAVRVVGDNVEASGYYSPTYDALIAAGIPVVTDPFVSYLQHNKFAILDGHTVWTGSTNWTDTGFTYNANNYWSVTAPHIAQAYTTEFEEMFGGQFAHHKFDNTTHVFSYTNTLVESYFSPSDGVEYRVADAIANAQESIYFAMFYWTSDLLGPLVRDRVVNDGLVVSGVWDAVGARRAASEDDLLCAAGVPLKVEIFGGKVHDKFAVIDVFGDDPIVILGSYNWTDAGAYDNDENTLIVHSAELAQAYYQEYLTLYNALPEDAICSSHSAESGMPACQDGSDNDYDGYVDHVDWDCRESTVEACQDGLDNDGDSLVDTDDLDCYRCRLFDVGIDGQATTAPDQPLELTTWLSPQPAAGPLTYTWSENLSTGTIATYTWDEPGTYTVAVTVTNWCTFITDTHQVTVSGEPPVVMYTYLPYVVRSYQESSLSITALVYDESEGYVEIGNQGSTPQDLTGWRIHSVVGDQWYSFPSGFALAPGGTIRIHFHPGTVSNSPADLIWSGDNIWSHVGDQAVLHDADGAIVDSHCYGDGCP